jgi:Tol biopolymer transport system component
MKQRRARPSRSADGRFLLYNSVDPQTGADLWVVPMVGDRTPSVVLQTPFREVWGAFSPDGRWVAYHSNESGRSGTVRVTIHFHAGIPELNLL